MDLRWMTGSAEKGCGRRLRQASISAGNSVRRVGAAAGNQDEIVPESSGSSPWCWAPAPHLKAL